MFSKDRSVMLLIDVQGRLAEIMFEKDLLFKSLQILVQSMKIMAVPIIWLEQIPNKLGSTREEISQFLTTETPIDKNAFSCCGEPRFMKALEESGKDQVILAGIESHICVCQTGCDLVENGYQVQVVSDCISSRTKENKDIGIRRMMQNGVQVSSVEMVIFELMKTAQGDQFREIVKLVK